MKEKKCKRCGDLFLAKGKQAYCGDEKIAVCPACGKEFSFEQISIDKYIFVKVKK